MYSENTFVFNQLLSLLPKYEFNKITRRYTRKVPRLLSYWQQFMAMIFEQLTRRESLRDLVLTLNSHTEKFYRLGFTKGIKRSTLADANKERNWRIFRDFTFLLIDRCRRYNSDAKKVDKSIKAFFDNVFAFDSSTITMNIFRYGWADYKRTKAGIKLHTLFDLQRGLPNFIHISSAKVADSKKMGILPLVANSMYVFDRAYMDLVQLFRIHLAESFFVIRAKKNLAFQRYISQKVGVGDGLRCDQIGKMRSKQSRKKFPAKIRKVKYYDKKTDKYYVYLTNNFDLTAMQVVQLYILRWEIELFFKWIKQHLHIKAFWGYSENAVNVQIWTAIGSYLLIYLAKINFKIELEMNEITQILSSSLLEKKPIIQVFRGVDSKRLYTKDQIALF